MVKACFVCKPLNGNHSKVPYTPALPASRVNFTRQFAVIDIDFIGQYIMIDHFGNKQLKRLHILIFECFSARAIHLETLSSTADCVFLLPLVCFANI